MYNNQLSLVSIPSTNETGWRCCVDIGKLSSIHTARSALRSGALRGTAQRRARRVARRCAVPRRAAQRRAALRSVARRRAASHSAARHCAALPAICLCKSYANEVNNQHGGHGSVFHLSYTQ